MTDNAMTAGGAQELDAAQVFTRRASALISAAAERYEQEQPRPEARPQDRAFIAWFRGSLAQIGSAAQALQISTLAELDALFTQVYLPYTLRSGIPPKLIDFTTFAGLAPGALDINKANKNTALYSYIVSWENVCKEYLIAQLVDESGSNINSIFILKSKYGMREDTAPQQTADDQRTRRSRAEILTELGIESKKLD